MSKKAKVILVSLGIAVTITGIAAAIVLHGMFTYVNACAHIKPKDNVSCVEGNVLTIDDLAEFSNYDTRSITGVTGGECVISEDKQSILIKDTSGSVTVYVYATNEHAPEWSSKEIPVSVIKGDISR